ncbi:MAG: nitrilase-related carbon-nitrogen hydrolase [Candidatus Sericytochromatia bacterium]|nr:nitrilase-related carbon-nitrogen hydrolase [Candidatus Sericytochromatia bacterium]
MNPEFRAGAAQLVLSDDDREANMASAWHAVQQARALELDLLLLPELWQEGYSLDSRAPEAWPEDAVERHPMAAMAREGKLVVAGTVALATARGMTNRLLVFEPSGALVGQQDKVHLFGPGGERRWFTEADAGAPFHLGSWEVGGVICYDLRFPEWSRKLARAGASLLLAPAQWPAVRGAQFRTLLTARALENQVYVLAANRVGSGHVPYGGHSGLIDPRGNWLADAGTDEAGVAWGTLSQDKVGAARRHLPLWQDRRPGMYRTDEAEGTL